MMSGAKKRAPKRRFKEFLNAGDWEQRKFKDIAFKRGKISEADLPYIEFEDINSGIGTLNKNILQKVGHKKGILFEAGDVLFGKLRPYLQNWLLCQFMGIAVGDFWVFQPQIVSSAFLYYLIQSEAYQSVANISSGTKMPRSSWLLVSETQFSIPKYKEATMIGEFFTSIDKNITLHQRKLDKLQATKKALLQEMFPEEGQDKPKRRFKGFTDAWEQRKLRNLLEQPITDGPHETPELYDSGIPFISVDAIVDNKIDFTKMRGYISKEYDDICAKKYKPQINDVYLVKSGATIGKVAIVETYDNFNIWSPLAAMRCGSITNPYFLYMLLQTPDLQSQVFNKASHGTQPNLSMRQLETFTCKVPKIEEQKLISRFLKQLDDVITLHQHKLDKLKNLKQAYLNEMFV